MSRRISSLDRTTVAIERDIGSQYDNVKLVADNITKVERVAASAENLDAVHENIDNINAVSTGVPALTRYLPSADYLDRLYLSITNLDRLHVSVDNVDTVSNSIDNVDNVSSNIATIEIANSNIAPITVVANSIDSVNTVAADIAKVVTVANDLTEAISEVETVADDLNATVSEIEVVANNILSVTSVGVNIDAVVNTSDNMTAVIEAPTHATTAVTSKDAVIAIEEALNAVYLGSSATAPTTDLNGDVLAVGALYFDTSVNSLKTYTGSEWINIYSLDSLVKSKNLEDLTDVVAARVNLGLGSAATTDSSAYATSGEGVLATTAIQPTDNISLLTNDADYATTSYVNNAEIAANNYADSLVTNASNWDLAYGWGNHADAGYISNFAETDPVFAASPAGSITLTNVSNWDAAHGWGDHSAAGYLTSYTETDPIYTASSWASTTNNSVDWNTAFSWGDHSLENYAVRNTSVPFSSVQLTGGTGDQGTFTWNVDEETLDLDLGGTTLHVGQEVYIHVRNNSPSYIAKGKAVYATGTLGNSGRITVSQYKADGSIDAKYFLGITAEAINSGEDGKIIQFGKVKHVNTSAWTEGTVLYADPINLGALTDVPPTGTDINLPIAFVISSSNNGSLFVRATNFDTNAYATVAQGANADTAFSWGDHSVAGYATSAGELSDIDLSTPATDSQVLQWNSSSSAFVPATISTSGAALTDLSDVDTTTTAPSSGDALVWNGSSWSPSASTSFSQNDFDTAFAAKSVNDLNDVDLTTAPLEGEFLQWDDTASKFIPGSVNLVPYALKAYTPANADFWGDNVPTNITQALDYLAEMLDGASTGTPADPGVSDRYFTTFDSATSNNVVLDSEIQMTGAFEIQLTFQTEAGVGGTMFGSSSGLTDYISVDIYNRLVARFDGSTRLLAALPSGTLGNNINTLVVTRDDSGNFTFTVNNQEITGASNYAGTVKLGKISGHKWGGHFTGVLANYKVWDGGDSSTGTLILDMPLDDGPYNGTYIDNSASANNGTAYDMVSTDVAIFTYDEDATPNTWTDVATGTIVYNVN
jgi:hypothetical protein